MVYSQYIYFVALFHVYLGMKFKLIEPSTKPLAAAYVIEMIGEQ